MKAARLPLIVLAAGALALASCGDDDDNESGSTSGGEQTSEPSGGGGGGAETVKLSETDFKITPASPKISKAGEVTFVVSNDGDTNHALEVEGPGGEQETDTIAPGESAELTVDLGKDGTFEMYCPIGNHKDQGMVGEITVGKGGSAASEDQGEAESEQEDSGGGGSSGY